MANYSVLKQITVRVTTDYIWLFGRNNRYDNGRVQLDKENSRCEESGQEDNGRSRRLTWN